MTASARNYLFTLNNYTTDELVQLSELPSYAKYLIFGKEVGESGTPHLQGYLQLSSRRTLSWLKANFNGRAHFEVARGSPESNIDYCSKDGDLFEFGQRPAAAQGRRSDLTEVVEAINSGARRGEIARRFPNHFVRYHRGFTELINLQESARRWEVQVNVYFGATGTGKTKKAWEEASESAYVHPGGRWFDGYEGEEHVIFDDFGGSEFKITYLLKLLDRYPMRVPIKGGFVQWKPKKIWITSNYAPEEWFPNAKEEHVNALLRRISNKLRFTI